MTVWSKQKTPPASLNSGNQYESGDQPTKDAFNVANNNAFYAVDIVESMGVGGAYSSATTYKFPNVVLYNGNGYMAIYKSGGEYASFSNVLPTNTSYWKLIVQKGDTGATGATGAKGDKGDAATIAVGTVTAGAAGTDPIVTNVGTSGAAVLNFTIPRGEQGLTDWNDFATNCIIAAPNGVVRDSGIGTQAALLIPNGIKVLMPNGRNSNGTFNNIVYTLNQDVIYYASDYVQIAGSLSYYLFLKNDASYHRMQSRYVYVQEATPTTSVDGACWYKPSENIWRIFNYSWVVPAYKLCPVASYSYLSGFTNQYYKFTPFQITKAGYSAFNSLLENDWQQSVVSGHLDLPFGLQIRWGRKITGSNVSGAGDKSDSFTFSKPLSNGILSTQITLIGEDSEYFDAKVTSESTTGITTYVKNRNVLSRAYNINYLVIGY